ncbi:hypothetical protein R9C00_17050 [Flammeovirgaceae bacterium SG7u.111]|nr:hypothetical protein [Flammeovirgaceae bacterium SG7u.132]WPO33409.1 hypothetical protein R9C00_17050 [Flammeovirgaceae bacterium SG7u.111]
MKTIYPYRHFLCLLLFCSGIQLSHAQVWDLANGAAYRGRGNTGLNKSDEWSLHSNIAGMARLKSIAFTSSYQELYGLSAFTTLAAGVSVPVKELVVGIQVKKLGDKVYSEQIAGLALAHQLGVVQLGLKANFLQINQLGLGSITVPYVEFGVITKLSDKVYLGAHLFNLTQASITNEYKERIPTRVQLGIAYKAAEKLYLNMEIEKDLEYSPLLKAGLEYKVIELLRLRAGANIPSKQNYFGLGLELKNLTIDYAYAHHSHLGASSELSLSYLLTHRKKVIKKQ